MVTVYCSERIQIKVSEGKRHMERSLEETMHNLPGVLSQWSTQFSQH